MSKAPGAVASAVHGSATYSVDGEEVRCFFEAILKLVVAEVAAGKGAGRREGQRRGPHFSPHQVRALLYLGQHQAPGVTIGELAEAAHVSLGWASRMVDELVGLGCVDRERDQDDRRVVRVRLAETAARVGAQLLGVHEGILRNVLAQLRPGDRRVVSQFLELLTGQLEAVAEKNEAPGREPLCPISELGNTGL